MNFFADASYGADLFPTPFIDPDTGTVNNLAAQRTWIMETTFSELDGTASPLAMHSMPDAPAFVDFQNITNSQVRDGLHSRYGDDASVFEQAFRNAYLTHPPVESLWLAKTTSFVSHTMLTEPDTGMIPTSAGRDFPYTTMWLLQPSGFRECNDGALRRSTLLVRLA